MSLVQAVPLKVTLALPAKGLLSLAASGVHDPPRIRRGERAEVPPVRAHRLDDHEVLVRALDRVDLHGLEQVGAASRS